MSITKNDFINKINQRIGNFFIKRANLPPRRSTVTDINLSNNLFSTKTYTKKSLREMVQDLPYLRGALNAIIYATCGTYKFITTDPTDKDRSNKKVKEVSEWANDPVVNFPKIIEKIMWSRLMRANIFIEIQPKEGNDYPQMYVLNSQYCETIYNDKMTKTIGIEYRPPTLKSTDKPFVFKDRKFLILSTDNFDASETGFPPVETLIPDANLYIASRNFVKSLYNSGGVGILAFILEEGSDDEFKSLKEDLRNTKGTSIAIKGKKLKIQSLSATPKDMQFDSIDNKWRQKVMSSMGVPPVMMALGEDSAFKDTSKSQMNVFSSRVRAEQRFLENAINQAIIKMFGDDYDTIRLKFDNWIDPLTQAQIWKILMDIGVLTPNIVREQLGLPHIEEEWADLPYNFNFPPQRTDTQEPMNNVPPENQDEEKKNLLKMLGLVVQDLESRIKFTQRINESGRIE